MTWTFDERTATELVAFFIKRAGGKIDLFRLMKLVYLADRQALISRGSSISKDELVAMKHGMLLSRVYDLSKGALIRESSPYWKEHISERDGDELELLDDPGTDHLTPAQIEILKQTWSEHHKKTNPQLRELHHELPEWDQRQSSSAPVDLVKVFSSLGISEAKVRGILGQLEDYERESELISRLRLSGE